MMKTSYALALILCLFISSSSFAQSADDVIDPQHFNYELLQRLYLEQFNTFRTSIKAPVLSYDPILQKAAQDQSDYCTKKNLVTHNQPENDKKYDPKKRVEFYHGNHAYVGENCLMTFVFVPATDPHTKKTSTISTYAQLAKGLFLQWKNSPPHYQNMINRTFTNTGLGVTWYENKQVMYATQVFGCAPYTAPHTGLKYSDTTWGVKEMIESKCKSYGEHDYLMTIFSHFTVVYNDTIYQYYQDQNVLKGIFTGAQDGIAVDLVFKNQFSCELPHNLHPSTVFDGFMERPRYRDELFKGDLYSNDELLTPIGVVPPGITAKDMQVNLIMIQNGMACKYSYPVLIDRDILKDLPIYPQWCKAEGTVTKGVADLDRVFQIPFEKNATKQDTFYFKKLKELLEVFDGAITSLEINAYSSVEGTEANNLQLQKDRADFIEGFVKKNMKQNVVIKKNALENWPKMLSQIKASSVQRLFPDSSLSGIRQVINKNMYDPVVSDWLDEQRVASIKIHLHKEYDDKTEARYMPLVLYDKMYQGDSTQAIIAYSRVINAYQKGDLSKHYLSAIEVPMQRKFLPVINNYLASIIVQSDIFDYSSYSGSYMQYVDSAEKRFNDFKPLKFNMTVYKTHLYFHQQLSSVPDFKKLGLVVDSLRKDSIVDDKLRYQLDFNYNLSGSVFFYKHRIYKDMYRCFDRVKALLPVSNLNAQEAYDVGKYFNFFGRCDETIKLLDIYLDKYPDNEDLIYLYVSTGDVYNLLDNYEQDFYYKQLYKLSDKNRARLCKWFNINYQLLRIPDFKKRICTFCKLQ